jgi:haloalkane dehalogenase
MLNTAGVPPALFLHGYPLNGYQWRGALEELHMHRRCFAPDFMGMGKTETHEGQIISPKSQVAMLAGFLDALRVDTVDIVANDSGAMVAQLFVAEYPMRVRSLLLTNCDVDTNNPPPKFLPVVGLAKKGLFVDRFIAPQLKDKEFARSATGLGGLSYTNPKQFSDEAIENIFSSPGGRPPFEKSR